MQIWFIASLVFAVLVALFAVMNSDPVTIRFFWAKHEFSQAIVILGSALIGAIIVGLLSMFQYFRLGFKKRELQNTIKRLEKEKEEFLTRESETNKGNYKNIISGNSEEVKEGKN